MEGPIERPRAEDTRPELTLAGQAWRLAICLVFSLRSTHDAAWRGPRNATLAWSVAGSAAVVALLVYVPLLHDPFGTHALGPAEVGVVLLLALLPAVLVETAKAVGRLRGNAGNPQHAPSVPGLRTRGHV